MLDDRLAEHVAEYGTTEPVAQLDSDSDREPVKSVPAHKPAASGRQNKGRLCYSVRNWY